MWANLANPMDSMSRLQNMAETDTESALNLIRNGKLMMQLVADGNLGALRQLVKTPEFNSNNSAAISDYHVLQMFRKACSLQKLDILTFMTEEQGFKISQHACLKAQIHDLVTNVVRSDEENTECANVFWCCETVQPFLRFLIEHGMDINYQRSEDLFTPLHIACAANNYEMAYILVAYGADVNAIAKNDLMPLNCAENNANVDEKLVKMLLTYDARRTWRKKSKLSSNITTSSTIDKKTTTSVISSFSGLVIHNENNTNELHQKPFVSERTGLMFDTSTYASTKI